MEKEVHNKEVTSTLGNVPCVSHVIPRIEESHIRYIMPSITKKEQCDVQSTSVWLPHQHWWVRVQSSKNKRTPKKKPSLTSTF
jgi:hypothetical protein